MIRSERVVEHVSQFLHLLTLALDVSFLELLREVVVQVFLHVELLNDLGSDYCLSYSVEDQVGALLGKELAVEHYAEEGLVPDIETLIFG